MLSAHMKDGRMLAIPHKVEMIRINFDVICVARQQGWTIWDMNLWCAFVVVIVVDRVELMVVVVCW